MSTELTWKKLLKQTNSFEKVKTELNSLYRKCSTDSATHIAILLVVCVAIEHPPISDALTYNFMKDVKFDFKSKKWVINQSTNGKTAY